MPQSPGAWQLPKRTSIDATTPDSGLDAARTAYPYAGDHTDVDSAVDSTLEGSVAFGRTAQLVGHGMPGVLAVGCGRGPLTLDTYIGLDNAATWEPLLRRLSGRLQALRLTGCYVGADQDGADLLERVSCVIDAPVLAPNGWAQAVAGANIALQDGSIWQLGQCGIAPHPVPVPNEPTPPAPALSFMTTSGEYEVVPVAHIRGLDFERSGFLNGPELHLDEEAAQELLSETKFELPQALVGEPLALPTGELRIQYADQNGASRERRFELLAEHLLRDREVPYVVYPVGPDLRKALPPYNLRDRG